ncbi:LEAF RUST 10 DISEASE-RESISTANCE LOCUS RECEPTOR-LIKE PROTEIN KINASE-like 2.4 [Silene latifolia]|uniref:LEAF RUST 10 DISEASE-RESISTANCE LOCUS RECEPTOR-LIKE PROTEIN KINASE-like 2.4 n=1 Tax=Silene latifolia TaxID=37657 RepID=UPI003D77DCEE
MFPYNSSLQFISISIFSIFLILPCSTVFGDEYITCTSALFSCGKNFSAVGYPFWGDDRPKYCGHPSLQLQCLSTEDGGRAQLVIDRGMYGNYNVSNMKLNQLNITLELQGVPDIPCSFNITGFSDLFKFTSRDDKITLVYNCPKDISLKNLHAAVPCSSSAAVNQAYYLNNISAGKEYAACKSFEFPVDKKLLDLYNKGETGRTLRVRGTCGSDSSEPPKFQCYTDQAYKPYTSAGTTVLKFERLTSIDVYEDDKLVEYDALLLDRFLDILKSLHGEDIRETILILHPLIYSTALLLIIIGPGIIVGSACLALWCCVRRRRSTSKFSIFWKSKAAKCPNVDAFLQIYGSLALTSTILTRSVTARTFNQLSADSFFDYVRSNGAESQNWTVKSPNLRTHVYDHTRYAEEPECSNVWVPELRSLLLGGCYNNTGNSYNYSISGMFPYNSSLQFISISIFSIFSMFLVLPCSTGFDDRYYRCASALFSCGNNISAVGYPFWGDDRPKYCGHPSLQLQCLPTEDGGGRAQLVIDRGMYAVGYPFWGDDRPKYCGHPSLQLQCLSTEDGGRAQLVIDRGMYGNYNVSNMKLNQLNITLELQGVPDIPCSFNITEFSDLFKFTSRDDKITLVYNCPKDISLKNLHAAVPCSSSAAVNQAYYLNNISAGKEYAACKSFEFPVDKKLLDLYNKGETGTLAQVVEQGFEVNYEYSSDCIKCNNSGGTCGSDSSEPPKFQCYTDHLLLSYKSAGTTVLLLLIIIGPGIIVVSVCLGLGYCVRRRRSTNKFSIFWKSKAAKCPNVDAFLQIYGSLALTRHTYADIKKMTHGFKDKLGEGGFAIVYKGKLSNGSLVAVKVLKQSKGNGEDFLNEVASISRTNHVNVVTLLGFCFEGNKRALIYEYMPNGSLEKFTFHGGRASNQSLPWEILLNIALGIARGLDYLHRGCNARILHFDIKPHNILLDDEFCPKISDFGLARLCPLRESSISMLETRGTIGYIAPEVFCRTIGGVSHKSDVYSFGMMVLDMVCGRKNLLADRQRSSELYFPQWIYDRLEVENESPFEGTTNGEEKALQRKMILVSLWCIQTYPSDRPSMSRVVAMLQGSLELIEMPPQRNLSFPPSLSLPLSSGTLTESIIEI